jgi:dipeptidyl aminopeptidase/acylaminoacyl peptidase
MDEGYHTAIFYYRETHLTYPTIKEEGFLMLQKLKALDLVKNIYIMGFSAGGHYAAMLASAYPELIHKTILLYPVITSDPRYIHHGCFHQLAGEHPNQAILHELSLELHIHPKMHPVFIFHTMDDQSVAVEHSIIYLQKLHEAHVFVEAHLFPTGRHGVSLATEDVSFQDMLPSQFKDTYGHLGIWVSLAKAFLRREKP